MSRQFANKGSLVTSARKRVSKNVATFIREELVQELGLSTVKGTKELFSLQHCVKLVQERGDQDRVQELVDMFRIGNSSEYAGIRKFYWWYKENRIDKNDSLVYIIFDSVSDQLRLNQADPAKFSGLGGSLLDRIKLWTKGSGNELEDVVIDYFNSILPKAVKFNATLATSPRSLLDNFGWNLWEEHVESEYGGRLLYLDASKEDMDQARSDTSKLKKIQYIKDKALQNGDVSLYDHIGKLLTARSIDEAYEELYNCTAAKQDEPRVVPKFRVRVRL